MEISEYLRNFKEKFLYMIDKEIEEYDEWFVNNMIDYLMRIAREEGLTIKQTEKLIDIFYRVILVKEEYNELYDNVLIENILNYLKQIEKPLICLKCNREMKIVEVRDDGCRRFECPNCGAIISEETEEWFKRIKKE